MDMIELNRAGSAACDERTAFIPRMPDTPEDTGLPGAFLNELLLRHLYSAGDIDLHQLAFRMRLPARLLRVLLHRLRSARLIEPFPDSGEALNPVCSLSDSGRARAAEVLTRSRYVGPAPVPLEHYGIALARQSLDMGPDRGDLVRACEGLALDDAVLDSLGAALRSDRSFIVHGPPGSGRSSLVGRLAAIASGTVWIPHALLLGDQIVQVMDSSLHELDLMPDRTGELPPVADPRWSLCRRPFVVVGSDSGPGVFDVRPSSNSDSLAAPAQIRAGLGTLVIDDSGQGNAASLAMLRRIAPSIERGSDSLSLPGGRCVDVPVRLRLVAVSSRAPWRAGYHRWGGRFGPAVSVPPLSVESYRRAAWIAATRLGITCSDAAVDVLLQCHAASGRVPLLASIPFELMSRVVERARWRGLPAVIDGASIAWAWESVFGRAIGAIES